MAAEVLHVFQHERGGLVDIDDVRQREEKIALFLVLKAVLFAEAQFLGHARDAERLAGKTGAQNVVLRDLVNGHGMNVAVGLLAKIGRVGFPRLFIPVGGEDTFAAGFFKRKTKTADAAEQINETKFVVRTVDIDVIRRRVFAERGSLRLFAFLAHASTRLQSSVVKRRNCF